MGLTINQEPGGNMKRILVLALTICLIMGLSIPLLGWDPGDNPEGHCESTDPAENVDGKIYSSGTATVDVIYGTAHKGNTDQANANLKVTQYELYQWHDADKDGTADAGDEPPGATTMRAGVDDAVLTMPVHSTASFTDPEGNGKGFIQIDDEIFRYSSKTETTITVAARGTYETTAAAHLDGAEVIQRNVWHRKALYTTSGAIYDTLGWDATGVGDDDGTEGDIYQTGGAQPDVLAMEEGYWYLLKIRVVDPDGDTNMEVGGVDKLSTFADSPSGVSCYVGEDGDGALGLEDDEVWQFRRNAKPSRPTF